MSIDKGINNFILYTAPSGEIRIEVYFEGDTGWLTQNAMGELFGVVKSTIVG